MQDRPSARRDDADGHADETAHPAGAALRGKGREDAADGGVESRGQNVHELFLPVIVFNDSKSVG